MNASVGLVLILACGAPASTTPATDAVVGDPAEQTPPAPAPPPLDPGPPGWVTGAGVGTVALFAGVWPTMGMAALGTAVAWGSVAVIGMPESAARDVLGTASMPALVVCAVAGAALPIAAGALATVAAWGFGGNGWAPLGAAAGALLFGAGGLVVGAALGVPVAIAGSLVGLLSLLQLGLIEDSPGLGFLPLIAVPPGMAMSATVGVALGVAAGAALGGGLAAEVAAWGARAE